MSETLLTEFFKQSTMVGLLVVVGYTLWKRYDTRQKETNDELKALRERFEKELLNDRAEFKMLIQDTNEINVKMTDSVNKFSEFIQKQNEITNKTLNRNSSVMECLTSQIKIFKQQQKQTA